MVILLCQGKHAVEQRTERQASISDRPPAPSSTRGFFRKTAVRAFRLATTPPRPVALPAEDNGRFIASARQHCLLIIAMGLLSAQLACLESERRITYRTFAYIEKVLTVVSAIDKEGSQVTPFTCRSDTFLPRNWHALLVKLAGDCLIRSIVLEDSAEKMQTRADPTGRCRPEIFEFEMSDNESFIEKVEDITNAPGADGLGLAIPTRTFAVDVSTCVGFDPAAGHDYVIVEHGTGEYSVMLHQSVYSWLEHGSYGQDGARLDLGRVDFRNYAPVSNDERAMLTTIDLTSLKGLVLERAKAIDGRSYELSQLAEATQVVLEGGGRDSAAELWGVTVAARTAVPIIPGALLGAAISLLYRIRRVDPSGSLLSEPWIAVRPSGVIETVAATAWVISLLAAAGSVICAVVVYRGTDWGPLMASMVSVIVLCQVCRYVMGLNRVQGPRQQNLWVS